MRKHPEAWTKWRRLISEQARSGQTVAAYCRERGLCAASWFAWKKRLSQASQDGFVAVRVVDAPASAPAIEVRLRGGRRVMVEPGFDAAHLRAVVGALEPGA